MRKRDDFIICVQHGRGVRPIFAAGPSTFGANANSAFAETFLRDPGQNRLDGFFLRTKGLVYLMAKAHLWMAALFGVAWQCRWDCRSHLSGAGEYDLSQEWSKVLHQQPGDFDRNVHRARHDDEICHAIFDRAQRSISAIFKRSRAIEIDTAMA